MKVLFAVSSESISEAIVKKYQKEYKEILSYKNVYYFNAILKEIQKDKSYDRIVISEDLESFSNNNYDAIDKFIFEKLDDISDEAQDIDGNETSIILICSDRRTKGTSFLVKLFGIGIYNALLGTERSIEQVCKLISKPRVKKEAKIYYKIDSEDVNYSNKSGEEVSEVEIQNILIHFKKLGKNTDKFANSFNNIASQYTDEQLKIIINCLPNNVRSVLENDCKKYQELTDNGVVQRVNTQSKRNQEAAQKVGVKIGIIENKIGQSKMSGPIVIPSSVKTAKNHGPVQEKKVESTIKIPKIDDISEHTNKKVVKKVSKEKNDSIVKNKNTQEVSNKVKKNLNSENNENIKKKTKEDAQIIKKDGKTLKKKVKSEEVSSKLDKEKNIQDPKKDSKKVKVKKKVPPLEINKKDLLEDEDIDEDVFLPGLDDDTDLLEKRKNDIIDDEDDFLPGLDDEDEEEIENEEIEDDDEDEIEIDDIDDIDDIEEDEDDVLPGLDDEDEEEIDNEETEDDDEDEIEIDDIDDIDDIEEDEDDVLPGLDDDDDEDVLSDIDDFDEMDEDDYTDEVSLPDVDELDDFQEFENDTQTNNKTKIDDMQDDVEDDFEEDSDEEESILSNADDNSSDYEINNNQSEQDSKLESIKPKVNYSMSSLNSLITKDKKIVTFIGTTKNGTSFLINNLAALFSSIGINTAILDMTKNKNSYYIYTDNKEELRNIAYNSIYKLQNGGIAEGIKVNNNLSVYTALPNDGKDYSNAEPILSTLIQNHSLILIDCDFDTDPSYFASCQEIYLVQSMDILTIQPLTAFLRNLKAQGVLESEKVRVVINKELKVRSLTTKAIIAGMSFYNDPSMSFMTELFNKDMVKACSIPFEENAYSKYLDAMVNCNVSINGYSKQFVSKLRNLGDMVYPLVSKSTYGKNYTQNNYAKNNFSNNINSTLDRMKKKY